MEIRIGIKHSPRELTFESDATPDDVRATIDSAISEGQAFLTLTDSKQREYYVATKSISYIEFGGEISRKVGFIS